MTRHHVGKTKSSLRGSAPPHDSSLLRYIPSRCDRVRAKAPATGNRNATKRCSGIETASRETSKQIVIDGPSLPVKSPVLQPYLAVTTYHGAVADYSGRAAWAKQITPLAGGQVLSSQPLLKSRKCLCFSDLLHAEFPPSTRPKMGVCPEKRAACALQPRRSNFRTEFADAVLRAKRWHQNSNDGRRGSSATP
jgi:hypothetical protein